MRPHLKLNDNLILKVWIIAPFVVSLLCKLKNKSYEKSI